MFAIGLFALCLAYLLPGHYPPWLAFQSQVAAAVGCLALAATLFLDPRFKRVELPTLSLVSVAIAFIPLVQASFGQVHYWSDGLLASLYLLAFALCIVIGASMTSMDHGRLVYGLQAVFVVAGFVSTGLALRQWLEVGPSLYVVDMQRGSRPFANLAQPNQLATLLGLALVSLLAWFETGRVRGWIAALGAGWLGLGMVMTQSRTSWLFVFAYCMWWFVGRRRCAIRLPFRALIGGVGAFSLAVACWEPVNDALLLSTTPVAAHVLGGGGRLLHWATLLDALMRSPWAGYGWEQVLVAQEATALSHAPPHEWLLNSHNLVLDLLLWNGVLVGGAITAYFGHFLFDAGRQVRDATAWSLLASIGVIVTHAMVEYPLEYAYFLLPLGLMLGALTKFGTADHGMLRHRNVVAVPLAVLASMLVWIGYEYLNAEESARQLRFVLAKVGTDKVSYAPPPDTVLLDDLRDLHRFALMAPARHMTNSDLTFMKAVTRRHADAPVLFRYATSQGLNHDFSGAERTLRLLCWLHSESVCHEGLREWTRLAASEYPELRPVALPSRQTPSTISSTH